MMESLTLLKDQGHEVLIFSLHPPGALKSCVEARGIPLIGTTRYRKGGVGNVGEIFKAIRLFKPDRIWLVGHNVGAFVAARISGVPAFLSIHFHHCERPLYFWAFIYCLANSCVRKINFISRYIFNEVSGFFKQTNQVVCFPNVFPPPPALFPKEQARAQLNIPVNAFVVGNAGWLISRKAFDVFLQTAALVLKEIPEAVFVIAGDGEDRNSLELLTDRLRIRESVIFLGWQNDLQIFFSSLDALLFNSNFDAMGRTPLEALSREIPVVCSVTHGGLAEFIRHGQDGFLINCHDTVALASEIVHLYRDEIYRHKIARSGCQRVFDICSPENHLKHLNEFLELA